MPQIISKNPKCCEDVVTPAPIAIESSLAPLGCIYDPEDNLLGKVLVCKIVDSEGIVSYTQTAYYINGTVVENYTGTWSECSTSEKCCDHEGGVSPGFVTEF